MLKTNDIQINKIDFEATKISSEFERLDVSEEHYNFLKDRLNNYKLYINSEYAFKSELQYDKSSQLLKIGINIIIPDHLIPKDLNEANEILMDPINVFQMFYYVQNEIYNRSIKK